MAQVKAFLKGFENVHFHAGVFPEAAPVELKPQPSFKFVHLDVDLHRSTSAALEWFYPRLVRGGIIVAHDYSDVTVPGVKGKTAHGKEVSFKIADVQLSK